MICISLDNIYLPCLYCSLYYIKILLFYAYSAANVSVKQIYSRLSHTSEDLDVTDQCCSSQLEHYAPVEIPQPP